MNDKEFVENWQICGHEKIVDFLNLAINNNQVAHAYLFVGPAHLGKYAVAQRFIDAILCLNRQNGQACGECIHCRQLKNKNHPDVYVVERLIDEKTEKLKKDITIDQVRDLKNRLQQASLWNHYKIALIPEAQCINQNAANALLKLVEEPTPKTVIILISDNIRALPLTIISRCQTLKFLPVAARKIERCLTQNGVANTAVGQLAHLSRGLPGTALAFLRDKDFKEEYSRDVDYFLKAAASDINARFNLVEEWVSWQDDEALNAARLSAILTRGQTVLRDFLLLHSDNESLVVNTRFLNEIKCGCPRFSLTRIKNAIKQIGLARIYVKQNISAKTILENLIINL